MSMATFACLTTVLSLLCTITTSSAYCKPSGDIAHGEFDMQVYAGFTFITREEWNASLWRNDICSCDDTDTTEMIPLSDPYVITIHHTATPRQSTHTNESIHKVKGVQDFHQYTRGWCDIAYNFLVDSAGNIFQGRPFWDSNETNVMPINTSRIWPQPRLIQGSHALNANGNNIGIAVIGCYDTDACVNGTDSISRYDATYTRLVQLVSWVSKYYNITPSNTTIVRHSHWKETECPGDVLGATQLFEDIIEDVYKTVHHGTGLCYEYYNDKRDYVEGGICGNSQTCNDEIFTASDQCVDLGQICCKVGAHEIDDDKDGFKDWLIVYIVLTIIMLVLIILLVGFIYQKRNEHLTLAEDGRFVEFSDELNEGINEDSRL